jgi:dynein heavy chain
MPEATTSSFDRAPGESPLPGTAFDWVPTTTYEAKHFVRPSTAELPVRAPESTPLDLFDDPELETKSPDEWLHSTTDANADQTNSHVSAVSRYFKEHGQFTWEPCFVTGYDVHTETYAIAWKRDPSVTKESEAIESHLRRGGCECVSYASEPRAFAP